MQTSEEDNIHRIESLVIVDSHNEGRVISQGRKDLLTTGRGEETIAITGEEVHGVYNYARCAVTWEDVKDSDASV